jgi:hypothetical protein
MNQQLIRGNRCIARLMMSFGAVMAMSAVAADHVVIMAISNYASAPLAGVRHDPQNALQMAEKLGYVTSGATILKDNQLTAKGMRDAFRHLAEQVKSNDRLFFYYSGHGASSLIDGQCSSSLVTQDEKFIDTAELKAALDQMKGKVQDALIIMDACFSGGLKDLALAGGSRSAQGAAVLANGLTGKSWTPKADEKCHEPVNFAKTWPTPQAGARGLTRVPENNFTFISAASERQVALDDQERGGLATISLLQCARDGVPTSGLATAEQLAACAQKLVSEAVPELNARHGTRWTPHTIQVAGNKDRPMVDVRTSPTPESAQSLTAPEVKRSEKVVAALRQIAKDGSNGNWAFSVQPSSVSVRLSETEQKRVVTFPYTSSQAGYGYVLYVGTDGQDMKQLFPEPGENNFMAASGEFPALRIDGPPGNNTYLFVMSQVPRDFDSVFLQANGGGGPNADTTAIQCELGRRNAVRVNTGGPCEKSRNAVRVKPTQSSGAIEGYAAQMLTVSAR